LANEEINRNAIVGFPDHEYRRRLQPQYRLMSSERCDQSQSILYFESRPVRISSQGLSIDGWGLLHFRSVEEVPARRCCHFDTGIFAENDILSPGDPSFVER
jgi:hypothetical protein